MEATFYMPGVVACSYFDMETLVSVVCSWSRRSHVIGNSPWSLPRQSPLTVQVGADFILNFMLRLIYLIPFVMLAVPLYVFIIQRAYVMPSINVNLDNLEYSHFCHSPKPHRCSVLPRWSNRPAMVRISPSVDNPGPAYSEVGRSSL